MIEIWAESTISNTSESLADQSRIKLKKGRFSGLEILEIRDQVNSKEYEQDPLPKLKH